MRKLALAALCLALAGFDKPPQPYTSKEGGFTVLAPGQPKVEKSAERTRSGAVDTTVYTIDGGKYAFAFGFSDLPPEHVKRAPADALLDAAQGNAAKRMNGTLGPSREVKLAGHRGREFQIKAANTEAQVRVFLVGHRLYELVLTAAPGAVSAEDAKALLESFQLEAKSK